MLKPGNTSIRSIAPNVPADVLNADGRPEFFSYFHESSKEWALAIMRLSIVIDNTPLVYDGDIMDWLSSYGNVKASTAPFPSAIFVFSNKELTNGQKEILNKYGYTIFK